MMHNLPVKSSVFSNFIVQANASYCQHTLFAGYVVVCRAKTGEWAAVNDGYFKATDALQAEIVAIYKASDWIEPKQWHDCTIISDCQRAVLGINNVEQVG